MQPILELLEAGLLFPDFSKKPSFDGFKTWTAAASISCPPVISVVQRLADGNIRLGFVGTTGFLYGIQSSSSFSNWQTISTNLSSTNAFYSFDDLAATNFPNRFYRVAWP